MSEIKSGEGRISLEKKRERDSVEIESLELSLVSRLCVH